MNKIIITLFLIVLAGLSTFAQRSDDIRGGDYRANSDNLLKRCYNNSKTFTEFERCYEYRNLPICPKGWSVDRIIRERDFPCRTIDENRDERRPFRDDRQEYREYKIDNSIVEREKSESTDRREYRNFPNDRPESFEPK